MDVRSRHTIELTHGQPVSYWASPVNTDDCLEVIMWIRCQEGERLPTASYLCSSPKPEQTIFFASEQVRNKGDRVFCRLFSTHQPTAHFRSRYRINPRLTRFVSGKASEYRWRPPKFKLDPCSRGREVARDVLRSFYPNPKKKCKFLAIGDESRCLIIRFLNTSQTFFLRRLAGALHASPAFA